MRLSSNLNRHLVVRVSCYSTEAIICPEIIKWPEEAMRVIHCLQLLQPSPVWGWETCFTRVCAVKSIVVYVVGLAVSVQNVSTLNVLSIACNLHRVTLVQMLININNNVKY